ncbi:hypothetical protein E1301_Tti019217 [Triplophysa tibetana]|uniref:Uncharacterized protein n=1 Tax=Triplophysa tibetana TaxID=1572043 RepID=A0A5A9P788_9TELE|nr:hypothetical protein E1301_Tti019217 [Triplophysa tibetana]
MLEGRQSGTTILWRFPPRGSDRDVYLSPPQPASENSIPSCQDKGSSSSDRECVVHRPNQQTEPSVNYALPCCPVSLAVTSLSNGLDLLALILHTRHLCKDLLLPLFPAGPRPELSDFSISQACPSYLDSAGDLFLRKPAYRRVNLVAWRQARPLSDDRLAFPSRVTGISHNLSGHIILWCGMVTPGLEFFWELASVNPGQAIDQLFTNQLGGVYF